MIIDASVVLCAFFPDEAQEAAQALLREHAAGRQRLEAPMLLVYEANNAVWQAERRSRISRQQAGEIIQAIRGLGIGLHESGWGDGLEVARQVGCSAYDAAYLGLAQSLGAEMITADKRLYNAVRGKLSWVRMLGVLA